MSIERPSTGILEDSEEKEGTGYSAHFHIDSSDQKVLEARERKAQHVYKQFVEPVVEGAEEDFTVEEVASEIRPPYDSFEIRDALEYGVREQDIEYDQSADTFFRC